MTMHYTESEERTLAERQLEAEMKKIIEDAFATPPEKETEGDRLMRLIRLASLP